MIIANYTIFATKYYPFVPEPEYQAILDKATLIDAILPTREEMYYQNEMVKELKTSGLWSKLDQLYLWYHSAGFDFSNINWINPEFVLTRNTSLGMSFISKEGARLHGTGGMYFTGTYNPQTFGGHFQLGNASFGWVNGFTNSTDGAYSVVNAQSTLGNEIYFRQHVQTGQGRQYFQQGGGYNQPALNSNAPTDESNKFYISTRTVTNNKVFVDGVKYRDATIGYTASGGSGSPSSNVDYVFNFGRKQSGGMIETIRMAFTGGNLTEAEASAFSGIWNNYINNI